ncbi:MAG: hypothetical protein JXA20_16675 [Spirochaetes bacterium]|nr:hypothetical protein [Spirochaetota bacterium]
MDMQKRIRNLPDMLWLTVGCVFLVFVGYRFNVPLAAWVAPVFILRYFRRAKGLPRLLPALVLMSASLGISMYGLLPLPLAVQIGISLLWGMMFILPYLADWIFHDRVHPATRMFVFPGAYVLLEYALSVSPFSSLPSLAYTQFRFQGLIQMVSVTGIWGITFLIAWFAALINRLWEEDFRAGAAKEPIALFAVILAITIAAGNLRLAFFRPDRGTVTIGTVTVPYDDRSSLWDMYDQYIETGTARGRMSAMRELSSGTIQGLFRQSGDLARSGARIILWSENSAIVFAEDLPALTLRAAQFAREHRVYLVMGIDVLHPGRDIFDNLAIVLTPEGRIAVTYRKSHPVFAEFGGERAVRGEGRIPLLDTPYGRIAVAICYDMDFPRLIRQAGRGGAGMLLVPALDWREISPYHSFVALFRGIENGCAVVRQTDHGMSLAADHQGTVVSGMDFFTAESRTMLFNLPSRGTATFYSLAGDWVVCGIMLFWLVQIPLLLSDSLKKTGRQSEGK